MIEFTETSICKWCGDEIRHYTKEYLTLMGDWSDDHEEGNWKHPAEGRSNTGFWYCRSIGINQTAAPQEPFIRMVNEAISSGALYE